ncbi:putative L-type lectin-domain containing receptor kinase S.7 [Apostasia shenzhenica]|uniref:Putative L-type lectin-domain containing receptor kinase S.7 n=1 Tax=Apostasia shenzhenica TaxID=1088818 RepID=A0A2I0AWA9_9ASPA|nr:putative L-type lectin-domain containing receptor kinase S.7 [Apostasia shenzhenica]
MIPEPKKVLLVHSNARRAHPATGERRRGLRRRFLPAIDAGDFRRHATPFMNSSAESLQPSRSEIKRRESFSKFPCFHSIEISSSAESIALKNPFFDLPRSLQSFSDLTTTMGSERIHRMFFLLLLSLPRGLLQIEGSHGITAVSFNFPPFSVKNVTLLGDASLRSDSLQLRSGSAAFISFLFSFRELSFSAQFSFSATGNRGPVFFLSDKRVLDLLSVEFGTRLVVSSPVFFEAVDLRAKGFEFKNGDLIAAGVEYDQGRRWLTVRLLGVRTGLKIPVLSTKFNLLKQFDSILYVGLSASHSSREPNLTIKSWSFQAFRFDPPIHPLLFPSNRLDSSRIEAIGKRAPSSSFLHSFNLPTLLLVISIVAFACSSWMKWLKRKEEASQLSEMLKGFQKFSYRDLKAATSSFSEQELIGTGLYASVYRATFPGSNSQFAVKRFNQSSASRQSYDLEVAAIHRLHHRNILELRGWCDDKLDEPLLVYDYMPNRSLESVIWSSEPLDWNTRYKIATGVADALVYLHEECDPPVIHTDIKEGNVMLDAEFNPKLGDFGLAISGPPYRLSRHRTDHDPPECQLGAFVTDRVDVFLYGSMVLELCSLRTEGHIQFFEKLRNLKSARRLLEAVDERLGGGYDEGEMLRLMNVSLDCVEEDAETRPSMQNVLQVLTSDRRRDEAGPSSTAAN